MTNMEKERLINGYPYIENINQDNDTLRSMGVSLVAFLDTIRVKSEDVFPVRLRVTYKRKPRYISTRVFVTKDEYLWIADESIKHRGQLRKKKLLILDTLQRANDIIVKMPAFNHYAFKREFKGENGDWSDVWKAFESHIKTLKQ